MKTNACSFSQCAWIKLIEDIFGVSITDKLDSIDIAWNGLSDVLTELEPREVLMLKRRYCDGLTFEEAGKNFPRKDGIKGSITKDRAMQIKNKALSKLRHPKRLKTINACVAGSWKLYY